MPIPRNIKKAAERKSVWEQVRKYADKYGYLVVPCDTDFLDEGFPTDPRQRLEEFYSNKIEIEEVDVNEAAAEYTVSVAINDRPLEENADYTLDKENNSIHFRVPVPRGDRIAVIQHIPAHAVLTPIPIPDFLMVIKGCPVYFRICDRRARRTPHMQEIQTKSQEYLKNFVSPNLQPGIFQFVEPGEEIKDILNFHF